MSQNHVYRSIQLPDNTPFELRPAAGKGWGAFATRKIERGAMILSEKPLFIIRRPLQEIGELDVINAYMQLSPTDKQQFLRLRDNSSKRFDNLADAYEQNHFILSPTILNAVHGCFPLQSRFNHSCVPNSMVPSGKDERVTRYAIETIEVCEEITFCYMGDLTGRTRDERHQRLRFKCNCKACAAPSQLSDMRRTLIRGLQYLVIGCGLDGEKMSPVSPLIPDAKLREAAENQTIPISTRFISDLLMMSLLQEEGMINQFTKLARQVQMTAFWFKTPSNARIAMLAISQDTWLQKFWVASGLYGQKDVADQEVAFQQQQVFRMDPYGKTEAWPS